MIDTIIISGGNIQRGFALDFLKKIITEYENRTTCTERKPLLVAADHGLDFFRETGMCPDIAVGDFDSLSEEGRKWLEEVEGLEVIRLKPEKDDSDTQSAAKLVMERGAKYIVFLGCTGTRLDHVMANLGLLLYCKKQGVKAVLVDENNYISLVDTGTVLKKAEQFGKYVSFFPLGGDVKGLTLQGFKYPLRGFHLKTSDAGLTVSNEIEAEEACVTYEDGELLMLMTGD